MEKEGEYQVARGGGRGGLSVSGKLRRKPQNQPLTANAIDRFLSTNDDHFSHLPNEEKNQKHPQVIREEREISDPPPPPPPPPPSFYYQDEGDEFLQPLLGFEEPIISFDNGLFFLEQGVIGVNNIENYQWASEKDCWKELAAGKYKKNSAGATEKRSLKRGCSKVLIKGQWSDEEDSKLVSLVKEYGERKWAQIAEKLGGRAGKQCRERWHNHLRPDIKKDRWSEEEERMLVEAHEKVGNRWAEIAKYIPGRTENTIKNHWNATKRRQISSRKNKSSSQNNPDPPHLSVLEDYIRRKNLQLSSSAGPSSTTTTCKKTIPVPDSTALSCSTLSDASKEEPALTELSGVTAAYDELDQLLFMQKVFSGTNFHRPHLGLHELLPLPAAIDSLKRYQNSNDSLIPNSKGEISFLYPDLYEPYMLVNEEVSQEEPPIFPYYGHGYEDRGLVHVDDDDDYDNQASTFAGRGEMDLMEMVVCSSQNSQGTSSM